jgi:hypothetical protein
MLSGVLFLLLFTEKVKKTADFDLNLSRFPDPDWIRIQSGQWIRIRRNPDPDPGEQKWPTKVEKT